MNGPKKGIKLNLLLLLFALVPLIISIVVMGIFSYSKLVSNLEKNTTEELQVAAEGLKEYYENELVAKGTIEYDTAYVDSLAAKNVNLTLFIDNVRFVTSIKDGNGKRIEGTTAADNIWAEAKKGNDYYADDVVIQEKDYYVYYTPLYDKNTKSLYGMAFAGKTCDDVISASREILLYIIVSGVVLLLVIFVIVLLVSKKVTNPLEAVATGVTDVADGNISNKLSAKSNVVESKQLINSTYKLQSNLKNIIGTTKDVSNGLSDKATKLLSAAEYSNGEVAQIAHTMDDLAKGATAMADNVQNINTQVIHMSDAIGDISSNVDNLADSSKNIKEANANAVEYMDKVSESSKRSVASVQSISKQIESTNDAIARINEAVAAITNIASQTNLLALNASIEAARAGDAGRGFAVVASEISTLSNQSNDSANDIKLIVDEIVEQSAESVKLSITVADIISEEQEFIRETQDKFSALNDEIANSLVQIDAITSKTESLDKMRQIIVSSISDLSAISEENAASNQEVTSAIDNIAESVSQIKGHSSEVDQMAKQLSSKVSYFK